MVELDLSYMLLLALAFVVGGIVGFLLRGLRRRRVEDMLQFFRQRDQEQDRKIANLERDVSDARGRLLAMKAEQAKSEKSAGELRAAYDEAQRSLARLREELATRPPAPAAPAELLPEDPAPAAPAAAAATPAAAANVASASPPRPAAAPPAKENAPAASRGPEPRKPPKKGRLP